MQESLLIELGERIRSARIALDLTQAEFAERARLHATYVASLERGRRNPAVLTLFEVALALDTSPSDLLKGLHGRPAERKRHGLVKPTATGRRGPKK